MTREQGEALLVYIDAVTDFLVVTTVERPRDDARLEAEMRHGGKLSGAREAFRALLP
jgi:hypothetical protein